MILLMVMIEVAHRRRIERFRKERRESED
jgi:hypothetical protein